MKKTRTTTATKKNTKHPLSISASPQCVFSVTWCWTVCSDGLWLNGGLYLNTFIYLQWFRMVNVRPG